MWGLTNAINDYLRLKIRAVCLRIFNLKCLLIELVIPNLSQIYVCMPEIYKNECFQPVFQYKTTF